MRHPLQVRVPLRPPLRPPLLALPVQMLGVNGASGNRVTGPIEADRESDRLWTAQMMHQKLKKKYNLVIIVRVLGVIWVIGVIGVIGITFVRWWLELKVGLRHIHVKMQQMVEIHHHVVGQMGKCLQNSYLTRESVMPVKSGLGLNRTSTI